MTNVDVIIKDLGKSELNFNFFRKDYIEKKDENDKFFKDDTLVYNTSFFEPLAFYPNRVIYKQGTMVTVALMENLETHEDSGSISHRVRENMMTSITKVYSNIIEVTDNISGYKKVGDIIKVNEPFYTTFDGMIDDDIDEETLELMMSLNAKTPKTTIYRHVLFIYLSHLGGVE